MKKIIFLVVALLAGMVVLHAQDTLAQYAGKYTFPDGSPVKTIEVIVENGKVSFSTAMGNIEVTKTSAADEFTIPAPYDGFAKFTRDEKGKINGMHVEAGGAVMDGTKDPAALNMPKNELKTERILYPLLPLHPLE